MYYNEVYAWGETVVLFLLENSLGGFPLTGLMNNLKLRINKWIMKMGEF